MVTRKSRLPPVPPSEEFVFDDSEGESLNVEVRDGYAIGGRLCNPDDGVLTRFISLSTDGHFYMTPEDWPKIRAAIDAISQEVARQNLELGITTEMVAVEVPE